MVYDHTIEARADSQESPGLLEIRKVLDAVDATALLDRLMAYRRTGRHGYPLRSLWRAYLASFILNLPSTNALIRRLQDDLEFRLLCGFSTLPQRRTFNRFILRLSNHLDLLDDCLASMTDELAEDLPGFGDNVAVDSTVVRTHSNPNRKTVSDPDASWTAKNSASGKDGKEWYFGYKYHCLADAKYDIPITGFTTTAKRYDGSLLPRLLEQSGETHSWFKPAYVMADKGYDSIKSHREILKRGAQPIIPIRNMLKSEDGLWEGVYTYDGIPTCMGKQQMEYVQTDPQRGHLYRCPEEGCDLQDRKGVVYCRDTFWLDHSKMDDPRRFPEVRRQSQEWNDLYDGRQSVERVFKSLKQSRRLEDHCVRGLQRVALHVALSVLAYQATVLVNLRAGETEYLRWQVRKVA